MIFVYLSPTHSQKFLFFALDRERQLLQSLQKQCAIRIWFPRAGRHHPQASEAPAAWTVSDLWKRENFAMTLGVCCAILAAAGEPQELRKP